MAKFVNIDKREELVEAMVNLFSSCHFKHKAGCLPPDCKECVDRFFEYGGHLLPEKGVKPEIHAHWVPENSRSRSSLWLCSHCMQKAYYIIENYKHSIAKPKTIPYELCPHCGAIMDEQT